MEDPYLTCSVLAVNVTASHPPTMPAELVRRALYLVAPSISVFDSVYRGVEALTAEVVVSLDMTLSIEEKGLGGGQALRHPTVMGQEDSEKYNWVLLKFLRAGLEEWGLDVTSVRIKDQRFFVNDFNKQSGHEVDGHRRELLPRLLEIPPVSVATLEVITVINGESQPPPYLNFDALVEDLIDRYSYVLIQDLRVSFDVRDEEHNNNYFSGIETVSVRAAGTFSPANLQKAKEVSTLILGMLAFAAVSGLSLLIFGIIIYRRGLSCCGYMKEKREPIEEVITKHHKKHSGIIAMADHSVGPSRVPGKSASATSLDILPRLNDDGRSRRISSTNNTLTDIKAYIQMTKQDLKGSGSIVCDNRDLPPSQGCDKMKHEGVAIRRNSRSRSIVDDDRGLPPSHGCNKMKHEGFATHRNRGGDGGGSAVNKGYLNTLFQNSNPSCLDGTKMGSYDNKVDRGFQRNSASSLVTVNINNPGCPEDAQSCDKTDTGYTTIMSNSSSRNRRNSIGNGPILDNGRGLTSSHVQGNADHKGRQRRMHSVGGYSAVYNRHTDSSFQNNNRTNMESFDEGLDKVDRASQRNSACSKVITDITDLSILGDSVMPDIGDISRLSRQTHRVSNSSSGGRRRSTSSGLNLNHRRDSLSSQGPVYKSRTNSPFQRSLNEVNMGYPEGGVDKADRASRRNSDCSNMSLDNNDSGLRGDSCGRGKSVTSSLHRKTYRMYDSSSGGRRRSTSSGPNIHEGRDLSSNRGRRHAKQKGDASRRNSEGGDACAVYRSHTNNTFHNNTPSF